jgi:dolichyl-phosphate beta-glucosyltransferase
MPVRHSSPSLSVIIPAYNEADRIFPYLTNITTYLGSRGLSSEILVVDDGSDDATAVRVEKFAADQPGIRLIRLKCHIGKGAAVRAGMLDAHGQLRLLADADGATPIEELARLEASLAKGVDIAIGSRLLASRDQRYRVKATWHRSLLGACFNWLVRGLGIRGIYDTQCGFKLFTEAAAQELFSRSYVNGYGFDLEVLYLAQRRGYRIDEVPVNWSDQRGSKVRVFRDGARMLFDLLAVRRQEKHGGYGFSPVQQAPAHPARQA